MDIWGQIHLSYVCVHRYVRSLDSNQLGGKMSTSNTCAPRQFVQNNGSNPLGLPNGGQINPCGLIANSNFNDSFTASVGAIPLAIDVRALPCTTPPPQLSTRNVPVNFTLLRLLHGDHLLYRGECHLQKVTVDLECIPLPLTTIIFQLIIPKGHLVCQFRRAAACRC